MIIIGRAKVRNSKPGLGYEKHHIIPRCCGGKDESENLVVLTYQEHYETHKELAACNLNIPGLQLAWMLMCGRDYEKPAEEVAEAKRRSSEILKINQLGENNSFYGHHHSEETKNKMSENRSGEKNSFYGHVYTKDEKKKKSELLINKIKEDPILRKQLYDNLYKAQEAKKESVMCLETKEIFESESDAGRKKDLDPSCISKCCKGKRKTCGGYHWKFI